jgi:hypothetical protein
LLEVFVLHRLFTPLFMLALLLPSLALAYPPQVRDLLKNAGQSFVVRAPGTIDDMTKKELEATAQATAARTGGKVYFIIDNKTKPSEYDALYTDLGLTGHDVVIASNGPGWSLQVGSLSAQQKQDILNREGMAGGKPFDRMKAIANDVSTALTSAKPMAAQMSWNDFQHANRDKGLSSAQMSDAYARYKQTGAMPGGTTTLATTSQPTPVQQPASSGHGGMIFLGIVVLAIVGIVFWRRRNRDAALSAEWGPALEGPTQVMTAVYMNLDGMEAHPNFSALMDQAGAVQKKIDDIKGQGPSREGIARLQSLTEEANRVRLSFDQARRTLR